MPLLDKENHLVNYWHMLSIKKCYLSNSLKFKYTATSGHAKEIERSELEAKYFPLVNLMNIRPSLCWDALT